jgi:hypothetical protein
MNGLGYTADCLEDGLVIKYNQDDKVGSMMRIISESSTLSLLQIHSEIIRCSGRKIDDQIAWMMDSQSKVSLSDLRRWKKHYSPQHAKAKDEFLRHKVFNMWSRRGLPEPLKDDADKP